MFLEVRLQAYNPERSGFQDKMDLNQAPVYFRGTYLKPFVLQNEE